MTPSRRKLLLVAAFFPPAGGVGTFRALKFAKYLPRFGVDVDVLAMREEVYRQRGFTGRASHRSRGFEMSVCSGRFAFQWTCIASLRLLNQTSSCSLGIRSSLWF